MRYLLFFTVMLVGAMVACARNTERKTTKKASAPRQGICGTVRERKGNQMPGLDKPVTKGQPVVREVVIYPVLTIEQVTASDDGFITAVPGVQPVRTVRSDRQGRFCADNLPAGQYSVLVREPKGLYGNLYDSQNRINAVTVSAGKQAQFVIDITHGAAF